MVGRGRERRIDPSASFTGMAVAASMVMEVCAVLAGDGPRFAGRMLTFEYVSGRFALLTILPDDGCVGHRRLRKGRDVMFVPYCDTPHTLAVYLSARLGWDYGEIAMTVEREIVRARACRACGWREELFRSLVNFHEDRIACACGAEGFEYDVGTELLDRDARFEAQGVPNGKAVVAHWRDRSMIVIREERSQ